MGRAPSKKTVADAVVLCGVMPYEAKRGFEKVCTDLGLRRYDTAVRLAEAASDALYEKCRIPFPDCWIEAAALIESGWRIGDKIEMLTVDEETPLPRPDPVADAIEQHIEKTLVEGGSIEDAAETVDAAIEDAMTPAAYAKVTYDADGEALCNGDYGADS